MRRDQDPSRKNDSNRQGRNSIHGRTNGYRLSAVNWKRQRVAAWRFYAYDWRSWSAEFDISVTWFSYRVAATLVSAATVGIGIGQIYVKLTGG